jgi:hypothetical protein
MNIFEKHPPYRNKACTLKHLSLLIKGTHPFSKQDYLAKDFLKKVSKKYGQTSREEESIKSHAKTLTKYLLF